MNAISEPCQQQIAEKQDEAFKFVLGRGARVWLARSRTVIGRITDVACSP
ncbi:hypothetical protein X765_13435 [Mesorhizobium sp. LSHC440B00]|nr:hypothetical protein X765_13435 [Mesorhizobium sp. LSHC440B00]ESX35515.1 hypothetical protein X763_17440 [Mesorhizobium sp. LSHC432A00]ESX41927.1 hypothetical protein X764_13705 [Mesorhizobium sp. LSHC440A00]